MIEIIHNNRCSKSRQTLSIMKDFKIEVSIIEYLKNPLSDKTLNFIFDNYKEDINDLIRKNEKVFKEQYNNQILNKENIKKILKKSPILIQRPIVIFYENNEVLIGRPPEKVTHYLKSYNLISWNIADRVFILGWFKFE